MLKTFENFINEGKDYGFTKIDPVKLNRILSEELEDGQNIIIDCHWIAEDYFYNILRRYYKKSYDIQQIICPNLDPNDEDKIKKDLSEKNKIFFISELQRTRSDILPIILSAIQENKKSIFVCTLTHPDKQYDDFIEEFTEDSSKLNRFDKCFKVVLDD